MNIELSRSDVVFIYGHFQKQLLELNKIEAARNCPFDSKTIQKQKSSYESVLNQLNAQFPELSKIIKFS